MLSTFWELFLYWLTGGYGVCWLIIDFAAKKWRRGLLRAWLKWLACLSLTFTTGPISIKPWHDALIKLRKTLPLKKVMGAPCLGSCRTMSSSCFLFVLTSSCALASWLSNDYWVIRSQLETERWRNFYDKALFLNFADSMNEILESNFENILYTPKKSSVQYEDDGKFPSNHVRNSLSCDQYSALRAVRMERREY